jgi:CHAT domain-containing protein
MLEVAHTALVQGKSNPAYSRPYYWVVFTIIGQ